MTAQPPPRAQHTVVIVVIPYLTQRRARELADWLEAPGRNVGVIQTPEELAHWVTQAEASTKLQRRHQNRGQLNAS